MPAGSPKYLEVNKHLASASGAIADAKDGSTTALAEVAVGIGAAVSLAMLDLADAIRGYTHAALHDEEHGPGRRTVY